MAENPITPETAEVDVHVMLSWRDSGAVVINNAGQLLFPDVAAAPGLYRLSLLTTTAVGRRRVYIGETSSLRRRLDNYRRPDPTQQTNLRVNALLREHLSLGGAVHLATTLTATVHLDGRPQPLDLAVKTCRLLAENAALVAVRASDDSEIINLP